MARKPRANGRETATTSTPRRMKVTANPFDPSETPKLTRQGRLQKVTHANPIELVAKTEPQRQMIEAYCSGLNIISRGSAGSGKSFVALSLALQDLMADRIKKIIIVRSAVQVRNQGFLPGDEKQKLEVYALPYKCIVNEILHNDSMWDILTSKGMIVFMSTSFIRGITLDNAVVILDEAQNCDFEELQSVLTRLGQGSRFIACGDTKQADIQRNREVSGFGKAIKVAEKCSQYFDIITFRPCDIVRSPLVKAWIIAEEECG